MCILYNIWYLLCLFSACLTLFSSSLLYCTVLYMYAADIDRVCLCLLRPRDRLRTTVMSMSVYLSVCLSVCDDISGTTRAIFTIFVHVVRGTILLQHVDDRPHRLSAGREWQECADEVLSTIVLLYVCFFSFHGVMLSCYVTLNNVCFICDLIQIVWSCIFNPFLCCIS